MDHKTKSGSGVTSDSSTVCGILPKFGGYKPDVWKAGKSLHKRR